MEGSVNDAGPRRRKSFGLRGTPWFALVAAAITVTLAGIVLAVSIVVFLEAREPAATDLSDDELRGNGFRGARVFVRADCANCHTLATAGATGTRGPNLDRHFATHRHSLGYLVAQIANGGNGMPAFRNRLSEQEIRDVATFLVNVAGRADELRGRRPPAEQR
jgi:mono/diheme cytochrome c family protein